MSMTQFLLILYARKWIILGLLIATVSLTAVVSLLLPKEYSATTALILDSKSRDPVTGQYLPSQLFPGFIATQVDIIKSRNVALKVVDQLKLTEAAGVRQQFESAGSGQGSLREWLADVLLRKISVEPSRESSVVEITFSGADPEFAALVANSFAHAYIDTSLELRVAPAKLTASWFDQQITQLRKSLDEAQKKLNTYQRQQGIVESEERLDVETRRLADLASQMVAAQSMSLEASSRASRGGAMPEVVNSPVVQNLKAQVAQGESKLAEMAQKLGRNHPDYQRVQAEVNTYKTELAAAIATAANSVSANASAASQRFAALDRAFANQKSKVLALKNQREEAMLLARDVENAQRIYDAALQRYGQSRMEAQATQTDIAVLNPASAPPQPSKPRVLRNLLLAIFFGTLLGVGAALVIELLDRRVRSGQDIVNGLEIPVLGEMLKPGLRLKWLARRRAHALPA